MSAFQFIAEVESLNTRTGGSIKVTLGTQENLPDEGKAKLLSLVDKICMVAIVVGTDEIKYEDIKLPDEQPEFKNAKTPSERLRNVLYVLWEQEKVTTPFETWRIGQMEKIIDHFKAKLNPK